MKTRRSLALSLVALLLLSLLSGCGKSNGFAMLDEGYTMAGSAEKGEGLYDTEQSVSTSAPVNQKLIRTVRMNAETEDMDQLLSQVEQRIAELGGYVESREVYNGSDRYSRSRYANLTIRIPAESLDLFVNQVSEVSNIVSCNESTEDVTLSYVATESRIKALETEEARLLELLAMAENMDDLLLIQSKLTDVRTELEKVSSQLKLYDNLVSYGTIHLNVSEVKEYTQVIEKPEGFFERIGEGFMESLKDLWDGIQEVAIFLIVNIPYFAVLAVIIIVIVLIVKANKKKKKKQPPFQPPAQPPV